MQDNSSSQTYHVYAFGTYPLGRRWHITTSSDKQNPIYYVSYHPFSTPQMRFYATSRSPFPRPQPGSLGLGLEMGAEQGETPVATIAFGGLGWLGGLGVGATTVTFAVSNLGSVGSSPQSDEQGRGGEVRVELQPNGAFKAGYTYISPTLARTPGAGGEVLHWRGSNNSVLESAHGVPLARIIDSVGKWNKICKIEVLDAIKTLAGETGSGEGGEAAVFEVLVMAIALVETRRRRAWWSFGWGGGGVGTSGWGC